MSISFQAVVAGHICLDVFPNLAAVTGQNLERYLAPGRLLEVGPITFSTGGPVSNTGLALNKLGIKTQLMGKIGADLFGGAVKQLVSQYDPQLADGMVVNPTVDTSYTLVINPPQVDRIFLHHPGANDTFVADDVRYEALAGVRHFHFGYPPIMRTMYQNEGGELAEIFRRAKATGVTTSLDMSLPDPTSASGQADWRAILQAALPYVDLFLPSAEEILYMLDREMFDKLHQAAKGGDVLPLFNPQLLTDISRELIELGVKIVCIKLGHRGFYLFTSDVPTIRQLGRACPSRPEDWANRQIWAPAFQVEEIGATGAGDASIAGFVSAFLRDLAPEEAIIAATAVGACNVEATDGISGIRPWQATLDRVAAGWPRRELLLDAPGWQFEKSRQLWFGPA